MIEFLFAPSQLPNWWILMMSIMLIVCSIRLMRRKNEAE